MMGWLFGIAVAIGIIGVTALIVWLMEREARRNAMRRSDAKFRALCKGGINPSVEAVRAAMLPGGTKTSVRGGKTVTESMTEDDYMRAARRVARAFGGRRRREDR